MKKYKCLICGFIYDEALGDEAEGLAPGTKWSDIDDSWCCPDCGTPKANFKMVEID